MRPSWIAARRAAAAALAVALIAPSAPPALARPLAQPAAALRAVVTLGRHTVAGQAGAGAEVAVEVAAPGGGLKGAAAGRALPLLGLWSLDAVDADGQPAPVAAGDRVAVRSGAAQIADTVPALAIGGDAAADRVTGTAPAGAAVTVTVQGGLGFDAVAQGAVADAGGRFAVDFAGLYDVEAGTTLRLDLPRGPFTFRAERPLTAQLAIRLYDATVGGVAPVGARVAVELRRRDAVVGRGEATAGFLGLWSAGIADDAGAAVAVRPGDRLRLATAGEATVDYDVPPLDVAPDAAADVVRGRAPAGIAVRVTVGGGGNAPAGSATAGADGRWEVAFAGQADLVAGTTGQLAITEPRDGLDVTVTRAWAVTRLAVRIGQPAVIGVATPGEGVRLTLKDARGGFKASAAVEVDAGGFFGGGAELAATLAGIQGDAVDVRPTDVLEFRQGAERIDLPIPVLTADVDVSADTVAGQAPAGASLRVTAALLFFTAARDVTADAAGRYSADFAGAFDLVGGVGVEVTQTVPAGHTITLATAASSIRVWPEAGRVDGSAAGGAEVTATLLGPTGQSKGAGTDTASFLGQFEADLTDAAGRRVFPQPGDRVRIAFNGASKEMTVPALGIEWDTVRERVYGEATAGGTVTVRARPPAGQGNGVVQRAQPIEAVGTYAAEFAPDLDLRAASRLELTYSYPNGDRSRIDRVLPYLDVQVGGNAVAGYALPRSAVVASLRDGATVLGTGAATAGDDQAFDARLEAAGRPVVIAAGRTVEAEFEARRVTLTADDLSIRIARGPEATTIEGRGPVSTALAVRVVGANGQARNVAATADAAGAWRLALPGGIDGLGGTSATVAFLDGEGHRQWALARIARLTAYLGQGRVALEAMPLAAARLTLAAAGGATVGEATASTDTAGRAEAALGAAGAAPAAGQVVGAVIGAEAATMTVADLRLALDVGRSAVTGRVPVGAGAAGRFAQLRLWPRDGGGAVNVAVRTDPDGAFTLLTTDPPGFGTPGAPLARYGRVELVHTDPAGHRTVAEATVRIAVFVPYLVRGARR